MIFSTVRLLTELACYSAWAWFAWILSGLIYRRQDPPLPELHYEDPRHVEIYRRRRPFNWQADDPTLTRNDLP